MLIDRTKTVDGAAVEAIEVRLKASAVRVGLAVAACMIIFLGGFFVGRLSKNDPDPQAAVAESPNGQTGQAARAPATPAIEAGTTEELEAALGAHRRRPDPV